jgi:DNA-binding transcriptional MerR regulator
MKKFSSSDLFKMVHFIQGMKDRGYNLEGTMKYLEERKGKIGSADTIRVNKFIRENW